VGTTSRSAATIRKGEVALDLLAHTQEMRGSRSGGSPVPAAQPRRQREVAEPGKHAARHACDFCRSALARGERHRLVWESAVAGELVLAELCAACATRSFGSRRSQVDTLMLVQDGRGSALALKVAAFAARGGLYLLIAVAFFLIVTLISSSVH
jgi:hypothetical protein